LIRASIVSALAGRAARRLARVLDDDHAPAAAHARMRELLIGLGANRIAGFLYSGIDRLIGWSAAAGDERTVVMYQTIRLPAESRLRIS
jgi:hypothetical protein